MIDLTVDSIYNSLNIDSLLKDLNIIKGAKCNILSGSGGQFCFSYAFSKQKVITYFDSVFTNYICNSWGFKKENYLFSPSCRKNNNILITHSPQDYFNSIEKINHE